VECHFVSRGELVRTDVEPDIAFDYYLRTASFCVLYRTREVASILKEHLQTNGLGPSNADHRYSERPLASASRTRNRVVQKHKRAIIVIVISASVSGTLNLQQKSPFSTIPSLFERIVSKLLCEIVLSL